MRLAWPGARHLLQLAYLDPSSLRLCRLALALVVCWDAVEKWPLVPAFYENQGSSYPIFALAEAL